MSSLPLISHHLFVAAVKDTNCVPDPALPADPAPSVPEGGARELPVELVDFGRPLPIEGVWPVWTSDWNGSA